MTSWTCNNLNLKTLIGQNTIKNQKVLKILINSELKPSQIIKKNNLTGF